MVSMHGIMFAVGYSLSAYIGLGVYFITAGGSTSTFPWRFPLVRISKDSTLCETLVGLHVLFLGLPSCSSDFDADRIPMVAVLT